MYSQRVHYVLTVYSRTQFDQVAVGFRSHSPPWNPVPNGGVVTGSAMLLLFAALGVMVQVMQVFSICCDSYCLSARIAYRCSTVSPPHHFAAFLSRCIVVSLHHSITLLPHCLTVSLHHCLIVSLHHSITHHCSTVSLHHCLIVSLHHKITGSLSHWLTVSLSRCIAVLLPHSPFLLQVFCGEIVITRMRLNIADRYTIASLCMLLRCMFHQATSADFQRNCVI